MKSNNTARRIAELSVGPFSVTRPNSTHHLTDQIQPNLMQIQKFRSNPTYNKQQQAYGLARKPFIQYTYTQHHIKHQLNNNKIEF